MREIIIRKDEANQRLDKFLAKYLDKAQKSFIYKMLRKKNIMLNDKKCNGDEKTMEGDSVKLWFSEETLEKFHSPAQKSASIQKNASRFEELDIQKGIIYEDEDCILYNKSSDMLSQKARSSDISLNEMLISYLEDKREEAFDKTFMPSICNRLDRNTSGIVIFGKSLFGLQEINACIKTRSIKKEYLCLVNGGMEVGSSMHIKGYLKKDERTNMVAIVEREEDAKPIETAIRVLDAKNGISLLLIHLITGRSHQIRAHLASIGHPILGDKKYGRESVNKKYKEYGIHSQALHAYRLTFPKEMTLRSLADKSFMAKVPEYFNTLGFSIT